MMSVIDHSMKKFLLEFNFSCVLNTGCYFTAVGIQNEILYALKMDSLVLDNLHIALLWWESGFSGN